MTFCNYLVNLPHAQLRAASCATFVVVVATFVTATGTNVVVIEDVGLASYSRLTLESI